MRHAQAGLGARQYWEDLVQKHRGAARGLQRSQQQSAGLWDQRWVAPLQGLCTAELQGLAPLLFDHAPRSHGTDECYWMDIKLSFAGIGEAAEECYDVWEPGGRSSAVTVQGLHT